MLKSRTSRAVVAVLMLALLAIVPAVASAQTKEDVERAEEDVEQAEAATQRARDRWLAAQEELEAALLELEEVTTELERLTYTIGVLENKIGAYDGQVAELRKVAQELVVEAYTSGGGEMVTAAFQAGSIQDLLISQVLIDQAADRDVANLDRLSAVSREMERLTADLDDQRAQVQLVEAEVAALVEKTTTLAADARELYNSASAAERAAIDALAKERREYQAAEARRRLEEESRKRSGSDGLPPEATPGFLCPVQGGASFIDTWGAPRSGGRRHKGVDMFAPRNTPLIASLDGRVRFSSNSLGGLSTHIYTDIGITLYYTHLESHPTGIVSGQRVTKGTVVGYLGNSGNARYTSPHLHFEIRPGGVAVNPYPTVRYYCP